MCQVQGFGSGSLYYRRSKFSRLAQNLHKFAEFPREFDLTKKHKKFTKALDTFLSYLRTLRERRGAISSLVAVLPR
jgi:hypothetical protein